MADLLRPEFTTMLADRLLAGACINLISPHGQGRRRTLRDLRQITPEYLKIFHLNMRHYKLDYKGFYDDLWGQVSDRVTHDHCFKALLKLIEETKQTSLLILHNFDEIKRSNTLPNTYHTHFFQALNSINGRSNIALLCVSEKAYPELSSSMLRIHLPTLSAQQLLKKSE
ncbi:MAG: hypothetical protein JKY87_06055 [Mariprofundus sp.]|nr:hypothetical protein [Mariprofundus sp.]